MSIVVMGAGIEMLIPGTKYRVAEDLEGNKYLRLDSVFNEQIYPIRPLPEKHGRLKDVDAILNEAGVGVMIAGWGKMYHETVLQYSETIVEAEGE